MRRWPVATAENPCSRRSAPHTTHIPTDRHIPAAFLAFSPGLPSPTHLTQSRSAPAARPPRSVSPHTPALPLPDAWQPSPTMAAAAAAPTGDDWKQKLALPPKDPRFKTEVRGGRGRGRWWGRRCIAGARAACRQSPPLEARSWGLTAALRRLLAAGCHRHQGQQLRGLLPDEVRAGSGHQGFFMPQGGGGRALASCKPSLFFPTPKTTSVAGSC